MFDGMIRPRYYARMRIESKLFTINNGFFVHCASCRYRACIVYERDSRVKRYEFKNVKNGEGGRGQWPSTFITKFGGSKFLLEFISDFSDKAPPL